MTQNSPPFFRWTGPRQRMFAPSELVSGNFVHSDESPTMGMNLGGGSGVPALEIQQGLIYLAIQISCWASTRTSRT